MQNKTFITKLETITPDSILKAIFKLKCDPTPKNDQLHLVFLKKYIVQCKFLHIIV